jgi:predicted DNA repair protein MutK
MHAIFEEHRMAGATLFTLLDDIASLLDDISTMSQVAINKTAGVLGDDLALNAKQVHGLTADRELPVVWRVAVGSAVNKMILIPGAMLISAFIPWAIIPLLMIGGVYLCYEGVEKLFHAWLHSGHDEEHAKDKTQEVVGSSAPPADIANFDTSNVDLVTLEKDKIRGAIRTDFILSAEIIVITLGTLADKSPWIALGVLLIVGVVMTIGVYGLVALIVKCDDVGLHWLRRTGQTVWDRTLRGCGQAILWCAPHMLRFLSVAGTIAMFLVGGGIVTHHIDWLHHLSESIVERIHHFPVVGGIAPYVVPIAFDLIFGVLAGAVVVGIVELAKLLIRGKQSPEVVA